MSTVKMGLKGLNAEGVHTKAGELIAGLTGNADFPAPVPSIADFTAANDLLWEAILASRTGLRIAIQTRNDRMEIMVDYIRQWASYVQFQSKGFAEKILSTGFDVAERGGHIGTLPPPSGLAVSYLDGRSGELGLDWQRVHGAFSYNILQSTSVNGPFETVGSTGRSRFVVTGLVPGTTYYFAVVALGAAGEGGVSAAIAKMAV